MKVKKIMVIGLCIISLLGCEKKVPEGISDEMYKIGQEAMQITEEFIDGDKSRRETCDKVIALAEDGAELLSKEDDEGLIDEYYSDELVCRSVLAIAQYIVIEGGEAQVEESLEILEELLE